MVEFTQAIERILSQLDDEGGEDDQVMMRAGDVMALTREVTHLQTEADNLRNWLTHIRRGENRSAMDLRESAAYALLGDIAPR